jgi:RNA polymerase sigma-70 factor (ECF subfamily)
MSVTSAQMTAWLAASPAPTMADPSVDAETTRLAIRAQRGDEDAFCALVNLHHRAARRVAAAALGGSADADEAVQDACIAAWRRIGDLDDPAAFRAWLLRIAWRKALDRRRSLRAWFKRLAHDDEAGVPAMTKVADRGIAADDRLVSEERDRAVAQLIRSLPRKLRDPFLLAAGGEHRYEEIASILRIPAGTVKWRVSEARRVLREKLTRLGWG